MKFRVEDMSCGHCTAAIEKSVAEAGGTATADLGTKIVTVAGLDPAAAAKAITAAGYTPQPAD